MKSVLEIVKPVTGYEGLYVVNNLGEIWSLNYNRTGKPKILKPGKTKNGYLQVALYKNGKRKQFLVHRLVAQAFLSNPDNLPEVNHRDENPSINIVENLEYCDRKYNNSYGTGNQRRAEKQLNDPYKSKRVFQYTVSGEFVKEWPSTISVQRELGYNNGNISACCLGKLNTAYGFKWSYENE